jgi:hypothetical protein
MTNKESRPFRFWSFGLVALVTAVTGPALFHGCKRPVQDATSQTLAGLSDCTVDDKWSEGFDSMVTNQSVRAVLVSKNHKDIAWNFGARMHEKYNRCVTVPSCPEAPRLPVLKLVGNFLFMEEMPGVPWCYPNALVRDSRNRDDVRAGFWDTGSFSLPPEVRQIHTQAGIPVAKVSYDDDSGIKNAARHSLISCIISAREGYEAAKVVMDNHEAYGQQCDGIEDKWTDYYNNEMGMRFGERIRVGGLPLSITQAFARSNPTGDGPVERCQWFVETALRGDQDGMIAAAIGSSTPSAAALMTHRPSIETRIQAEGFFPEIGRDSTTRFIPPPMKHDLPHTNSGGLKFLFAAPIPLRPDCVAKAQ